jgi:hypothetical protein
MKTINQYEIAEINVNDPFNSFWQAFNSGGSYGLEYVLDELFQDMTAKPVSGSPTVDWFGLCG